MKIFRSNDPGHKGSYVEFRVYPEEGERVPIIATWSEVMIHFGLADKPIEVSLVRNRFLNGELVPPGKGRQFMAQVWKDGKEFSAPILPSEAGFYTVHLAGAGDERHGFYIYGDGDRLPKELIQEHAWNPAPGCPGHSRTA